MKLDRIDFSKYLGGNPAMLEIWSDLQERIDQGVPLSQVQTVVVREWLVRAGVVKQKLEDKAQRDMLSDEEYAELAALRQELTRMEGHR
jgi:hypothetical protein